jgi:hypothetical protein
MDMPAPRREKSPELGCTAMAEHAITREDGCHPPSGQRERGMSHCVHPLMHAMQPARLDAPPNGIVAHTRRAKLRGRHHPMLPRRNSRNRPVRCVAFSAHMTYKATQTGDSPPILV